MSWVKGPFRAFWTLASEPISERHNSFFYAEIDDRGVCRGNTGRILAQSRHPMVYGSPRPLKYRAMRAVLHRNITMTIKMTCKGGVIFAIIDFLLCIARTHLGVSVKLIRATATDGKIALWTPASPMHVGKCKAISVSNWECGRIPKRVWPQIHHVTSLAHCKNQPCWPDHPNHTVSSSRSALIFPMLWLVTRLLSDWWQYTCAASSVAAASGPSASAARVKEFSFGFTLLLLLLPTQPHISTSPLLLLLPPLPPSPLPTLKLVSHLLSTMILMYPIDLMFLIMWLNFFGGRRPLIAPSLTPQSKFSDLLPRY